MYTVSRPFKWWKNIFKIIRMWLIVVFRIGEQTCLLFSLEMCLTLFEQHVNMNKEIMFVHHRTLVFFVHFKYAVCGGPCAFILSPPRCHKYQVTSTATTVTTNTTAPLWHYDTLWHLSQLWHSLTSATTLIVARFESETFNEITCYIYFSLVAHVIFFNYVLKALEHFS